MRVYLSLGSNLGNRSENLAKAREGLFQEIVLEKFSSIYESPPYGFLNQPKFLNQCLRGETNLSPEQLLKFIKDIEEKMGREKTFRWGPRKIDIDILFYDALILKNENLIIPHFDLQNRKFFLQPLVEIEPKLLHPLLKRTIEELLKKLN